MQSFSHLLASLWGYPHQISEGHESASSAAHLNRFGPSKTLWTTQSPQAPRQIKIWDWGHWRLSALASEHLEKVECLYNDFLTSERVEKIGDSILINFGSNKSLGWPSASRAQVYQARYHKGHGLLKGYVLLNHHFSWYIIYISICSPSYALQPQKQPQHSAAPKPKETHKARQGLFCPGLWTVVQLADVPSQCQEPSRVKGNYLGMILGIGMPGLNWEDLRQDLSRRRRLAPWQIPKFKSWRQLHVLGENN